MMREILSLPLILLALAGGGSESMQWTSGASFSILDCRFWIKEKNKCMIEPGCDLRVFGPIIENLKPVLS